MEKWAIFKKMKKKLSLGKNQHFLNILRKYRFRDAVLGCFILLNLLPDGLVLIEAKLRHFKGFLRFQMCLVKKNCHLKSAIFHDFLLQKPKYLGKYAFLTWKTYMILKEKFISFSENMDLCLEFISIRR